MNRYRVCAFVAILSISPALAVADSIQIVNLQASPSATQATAASVLTLGPGTYNVTWAGIAGGGLYDGWSYNSSNTYSDRYGFELCPTCTSGQVVINSSNPSYATAAAALSAYQNSPSLVSYMNGTNTTIANPFSFSLNSTTQVAFFIPDGSYASDSYANMSSFSDDSGGVSLIVAQVGQVPEPASLLLLGTGALAVAVGVRRRIFG